MKTNISLCITTYDRDIKLLEPLLNKLSEQTAAPFEIIVYTSGFDGLRLSSSISICGEKVPMYSIDSSKRTMQSIARNVCASIASGDIIMFFDVDDYPHHQKVEITKHIFNKYSPDFFLHNYSESRVVLDSNIDLSSLTVEPNLSINPNNTNIVCANHNIHHAHISVKKSIFDKVKYNESPLFYRKEDGKFCQDLLKNNYRGLYSPEILVEYTH
jgi:glycosyltransferase involved in cell wall biosynthesis